jgi:hypothetical protein
MLKNLINQMPTESTWANWERLVSGLAEAGQGEDPQLTRHLEPRASARLGSHTLFASQQLR